MEVIKEMGDIDFVSDMEIIKKNIHQYIKVHKELHGPNFKHEDVIKDICTSFPEYDRFFIYDIFPSMVENYEKSLKQYGLIIGRFQPFTNGHNAIVQDIIRDHKIPLIIIGGVNKVDERHPLTYDDIVKIIKKVYPFGCKFVGIEDSDNWTRWYMNVQKKIKGLGINKNQITLYSHNKDIDRQNFECNGKKYQNEFYSEIFKEDGIKIKNLEEFVDKKGKVVHASDVRKSEQYAIKNLDARIYVTLKNNFGWWS